MKRFFSRANSTQPGLLFVFVTSFVMLSCKHTSIDQDTKLTDNSIIRLSPIIEKFLASKGLDTDGLLNGQVIYKDIKFVDSLKLVSFEPGATYLAGIEHFSDLKYLSFQGAVNDAYFIGSKNKLFRPALDTLDVSKNLKLEYLDCSGFVGGDAFVPSIRHLRLGKNATLKTVKVSVNMLQSIDLSGLSSLKTLDITSSFDLSVLNVCGNTELENLYSNVGTTYVSSQRQIELLRKNTPGGYPIVNYQLCK